MGSTSPELLPTLHTSSALWPGLPAGVFLSGLLRRPCGGSLSPCELRAEPGMYHGGLSRSQPFLFLVRKLVLDLGMDTHTHTFKYEYKFFRDGPVVKNLPSSAEHAGLIPHGELRPHMLQSS